jgi:hypothetical protein
MINDLSIFLPNFFKGRNVMHTLKVLSSAQRFRVFFPIFNLFLWMDEKINVIIKQFPETCCQQENKGVATSLRREDLEPP